MRLPTAPPVPIRFRRSLTYLVITGATALASVTAPGASAATKAAAALVSDPASIVNPFIGTTANGNVFPGADVPFGMAQWSPDTTSRPPGGGYQYNDSAITGFSLTHISGPGCGGAGDIPVLPEVGAVSTSATESFSHSSESASAGYYSVNLGNGVKTELTETNRTGMARFTFPATTQADLVFKLNGSQNGDSATSWTVVSNTEVTGSVTSGGFCGASASYTVYFDMVFDQAFTSSGTSYVVFNTTSNQTVQAKVGLSFVSVSGAKANLAAENTGWNFSATQSAAHSAWNAMLGRVQIAGGTAAQQASFYTALYHSLLYPMVFSDVNGQYTGVDGKVHTVDAGHSAFYTTFSGWDTYRTQTQLAALLAPTQSSDTAQSMVDDYAQSGMLPKWDLNNGETYVMVGDPGTVILADYYAFGARNFDTATALKDMIAEANNSSNIRPGLNYQEQLSYLPNNGSYGCCNFYGASSTSLEYDSADAALASFAGSLGDTADQTAFVNRAQDWHNLFNYGSGFIQPRDNTGSWTGGFDPTSGNNFVEGTSWEYTAMVPFNLRGLADAKGGNAAMNTFLDSDLSSFIGANGRTDVTNQPGMDVPWEYDYAGTPYKTQNVVRQIQTQLWSDTPGGLAPGNGAANDDLGSESAWYAWSALGMYPETPGTGDLALGSPMFSQAVITLPSGNTLTINGNGAADNAPYVQSATWNAGSWNNAYLPAGALTSGGTFTYTLGTAANTSWAAAPSSAPPSYQGSLTYSDAGVSTDSATSNADFDGSGYSYSATALSTAGVNPGSKVTANGISFTWPSPAPGAPNNYEANGQSVPASGSGSISFLGSANNGPSSGTATVNYTDGTTQSVPITFSDWTLGGGSGSPASGNTIAVTTTYRNHAGAAADNVKAYAFATAPVSLTSGKTVASVRLPSDVNTGGLHVFSIAFGSGGGTNPPTGPIVSGVSSSLCVDDSGSSTTNGSHIQIWTCNGTGAQNWTVQTDGTLHVLTGCMDVTGAGTAVGTKIEFYQCNGTVAQQWQARADGSLLNPNSGLCLDDPGSSTTSGTQLQLYTCNGTNAQKWTLP